MHALGRLAVSRVKEGGGGVGKGGREGLHISNLDDLEVSDAVSSGSW